MGKVVSIAYEEPRESDAEERQAAHPFFITYWHPRGGKREALLWTKDEASAIGLLQSAVPGADVVEVEQREVEPGMKRGKNVYVMGGEAMETEASEYVAVDSRGRKVFGPSKDYEQAKRHAAQAGGVVHFVMGASESCACGASDCVGVHTHGPPPAGTTVVAAAEGEGTPHYRELDLAPPPAPLEPYTKELRWHRDPALDSTYHAESPLGRFTVLKRTPDRRHDVLPWQVLRKGEPIGQADDKAGAVVVDFE